MSLVALHVHQYHRLPHPREPAHQLGLLQAKGTCLAPLPGSTGCRTALRHLNLRHKQLPVLTHLVYARARQDWLYGDDIRLDVSGTGYVRRSKRYIVPREVSDWRESESQNNMS